MDGFLKQRETYEIMRPEDVGMTESRVVLTARTGRHGLLRPPRRSWDTPLSEQELDQAYHRFLIVADKKQEVFDEDLIAILHDEIHPLPEFLNCSTCTSTAALRRFRRPPSGWW